MKIANGILMAIIAYSTFTSSASGQAWLPAPKQLSAGISYQFTSVGDHLLRNDNRLSIGEIDAQTAALSLDYGIRPRLAGSASVALVSSRYEGTDPESALDDGSWHGGLQDLAIGLRYMAVKAPVTITPSIQLGIPTRSYETIGHSAIGRDLMSMGLGVHFGWVPRGFVSGLFLQGSYGFTVMESVQDVRIKRSSFGLQAGYFLTQKLILWSSAQHLHSHDGLDWLEEIEHGTLGDHFHIHDQLAKTIATTAGGGVNYTLGGLTLSGSVLTTVYGESTHDATMFSFSMSQNFSLAR